MLAFTLEEESGDIVLVIRTVEVKMPDGIFGQTDGGEADGDTIAVHCPHCDKTFYLSIRTKHKYSYSGYTPREKDEP